MPLLVTQGLGSDDSGGLLTADSIVATPYTLTLEFSLTVSLIGNALNPAFYIVTPLDDSTSVTIISIQVVGNTVILTTTDQTNGGNYLLTLPSLGIINPPANIPLAGPFQLPFTGAATLPIRVAINVIDARKIEVVFNKPMNEAEALNKDNYAFSHGLQATGVVKHTDSAYYINTTRQTHEQTYNIVISNLHDTSGNLLL